MTSQRRRLLAITGIILGIVAIIFGIVGLYIRFSGVGNPTGAVYIYVGFILAIGGVIAASFASRSRKE